MSLPDLGSIIDATYRSEGNVADRLTSKAYEHHTPLTFRAVLTLGYLALTVAVITAYQHPATGYELSIYAPSHTPLTFWVGVGVGLLSALLVALSSRQRGARFLALVLGGATMTAVVSLPLIRGYYFYGQTDPLIHLGWIRAIAAGSLSMTAVLYPGGHASALLLGDVTGLSMRQSMMVLVVAFVVVFFAFVPLAVRLLGADSLTVTVATFSGFMLLPINNVSTFLRFHPFSLALLFLPLVFYVLLRHLLSRNRAGWGLTSGTGLTLLVVGLSVLLLHPQVMLNYLVLLGALAGYQLVHQRAGSVPPEQRLGGVSLHFLLLGILFFIWITGHWQLQTTIEQTRTALFNVGQGGTVGQVVSERSASASTIGANLGELFTKLFAVSAVYFALMLVFVVTRLTTSEDEGSAPRAAIYRGLLYGGLALFPLVAVNSFGKVSTYLFRHVGFAMVFATIIGALAIRHYVGRSVTVHRRLRLRPILGTILVVGLVLSIVAVYPSPYIYLPNHHVTEAQMEGYGTAFENQPPGATVWFGGVRTTSNRYESALIDAPASVWSGAVPGDALADPRAYYADHPEASVQRDHYLVVTTYDVEREVHAYDQLRYTATQIDALEGSRGVHRISSNGEFTLYYVDLPAEAGR